MAKYDLTDKEISSNGIFFDLDKDLLVFPVYNGDRLVVSSGRYFGSKLDHPKYITHGWKSKHYKLIPNKDTKMYVLTEDMVSAIKVGRVANTIPLLGTDVPKELMLSLIGKASSLRLWLDFDKALSASKLASKIRQFIPDTATIITPKDPKCYSTEEIRGFIF